jgi:dihydrofolate synthase/folylpolyglutamate synthase
MYRDDRAFNAVLDDIYSSFMAVKSQVSGLHDREARHPEVILNIARELDLLPDPSRTVCITGSKGKGTTSRMIAHAVQEATAARVALFVSPEEITHNDRMRVNGASASIEEFCELYARLSPAIAAAKAQLKGAQYLSPLGLFLLLALQYFKDHAADYVVLECGRGAEFDEVGQVPSLVSVVTSVLGEHVAQIGPSLREVAENKLAIARTSKHVILSEQVAQAAAQHGVALPNGSYVVANPTDFNETVPLPQWVRDDAHLAAAAAEILLGRRAAPQEDLLLCSASFGVGAVDGTAVYYDGSVQVPSLDLSFFETLKDHTDLTILMSLPDDKDGAGVRSVLQGDLGLNVEEVILTGTRGYLNYTHAQTRSGPHHVFAYEDTAGFHDLLARSKTPLYCLGTQTYIRLVKAALAH